MKFLHKGVWTLVLITAIAGLVLMITGVAFGASLGVYINNRGTHVVDEVEKRISETALREFNVIEVTADFSDIEFVESDEYGFEIIYYTDNMSTDWSAENGKLKIVQDSRSSFSFNFGITSFKRNVVKIYLPGGVNLREVTLKTDSGNIRVGNFTAENTEIRNSFGDVSISDISCGHINIILDSGDFTGSSLNADIVNINNKFGKSTFDKLISVTLDAEVSSGDFTIKNSEVEALTISNKFGNITAENIVTQKMNIESDSGNTKLIGEFNGKTEIFSKFGDVSLETIKQKDYYSYDISAQFGKLIFDNEKLSDNSYVRSGTILENDIKINSSSGDIRVKFGQ